jgi:prepilin-type processing-associated H-X9-DG protein
MADRKQQRQLLGYLLGALDDGEKDRLDHRLVADPVLRQKLLQAEESLEPLRAVERVHRPPEGLAARTCRKVFAYSEALASLAIQAGSMRPPRQRARAMSPSAVPPSAAASWRWSDLVVAVVVFLAVSCSIFPALQHSRASTRLNLCQDNLRQLGLGQAALHEFHGDAQDRMALGRPVANAGLSLASVFNQGGLPGLLPISVAASPSPSPKSIPPLSPANLGRTFVGHQGFTQAVQGQNLLFCDGHVMFLAMGPVFEPPVSESSDESIGGDEPPVATWPVGPNRSAGAQSDLAPIILVGHPRQ